MSTPSSLIRRRARHARIRAKVSGTPERPRLHVFRSTKHIYAQLIDDQAGKTILTASDLKIKKGNKTERAAKVGETLATLAKEKKITRAVFDRAGYKYHGRVKAVASSAREGGLKI